jgi:tRNA nucleotidyltransferase (CCA-adding enzyme)
MKKNIYMVGGAVRDMLLGMPNYDKDYVAVGFKEEDFKHLKKVGKDFPVFLREDGSELALARLEKKVATGYNGFQMDTTNVALEDDLARRDLTINSMALDEESGDIIDPYNAQDDIDKKILRHTSVAFVEDPIRVLRLARFRAKLGYDWKIHPSTKVLVYKMREELESLQADRVYKELEKVFALHTTDIFYETLFELGVLDVIFPSIYELNTLKEGTTYHQEVNVFEHTMMVLRNLAYESPLLKLTALYHDIAKPYCYRNYGNSANHEKVDLVEPLIDIQIPTKLKNKMLFLIKYHIKIYLLDEMKPTKIATFFEEFKKDRDLLINLIEFADADNLGRITSEKKETLDKEKLLALFDDIANYSPKEWIESQEDVSSENIKQHIHKKNIEFVKKYF